MKNKGILLLFLMLVMTVQMLVVSVVAWPIPMWDEDKKWGPELHQDWAYAYVYGEYNVHTKEYGNIQHNWDSYWPTPPPDPNWEYYDIPDKSDDMYHPWTRTRVYWSDNGYIFYLDANATAEL